MRKPALNASALTVSAFLVLTGCGRSDTGPSAGRAGGSPPRTRLRTEITTFGADFAVAHVEFRRDDSGKIGRQSQTWIRTEDGWKIASAHVSLMQEGVDQRLASPTEKR